MKIQKQDLYHGPALMQIVEHRSFKALNRASGSYGHYRINTDREVFTKYRGVEGGPWTFTFRQSELAAIREAATSEARIFFCLVCGHETICALSLDEFLELVDVKSKTQQWIRVDVPSGGSCRVSGSEGQLDHVVPHNAYPEKLFSKERSMRGRVSRNEKARGRAAEERDGTLRFTLPFGKETMNMFRWQGDVNGRRLSIYIPKARLSGMAPKQIDVRLEPKDSGVRRRSAGPEGGINLRMRLVERFRTRVKYSPIGEREIGDLFLPSSMSFGSASQISVRISWR